MKYIFKSGNEYVGMDYGTGGYPFNTDNCMQVKVWHGYEKAIAYGDMFKDEKWTMHELHGLITKQVEGKL